MSFDNCVIVNFRDVDGNFPNEDLKCSYCKSQAEVFVITMEDENGFIISCKGCLSEMIESINRAHIKYMKNHVRVD